jgi:hypothetical protein
MMPSLGRFVDYEQKNKAQRQQALSELAAHDQELDLY